jgi:hypothetical protein
VRGALRIESVSDPNWSAALAMLKDGEYIVFRGVRLTLMDHTKLGPPTVGRLLVQIPSEWLPANVDERRARVDLARGDGILDALVTDSPDIREFAEKHRVTFELIHDYGNMDVLIATMVDGQITWGHVPWR